MKELLARNWKTALSEVLASLVGTLGIVAAISGILSLQIGSDSFPSSFMQYFRGGQIGLPTLALSGIVFISLSRHGPLNPFISLVFYILLLGPIISTAFIMGLNPGFQEGILTRSNIRLLWTLYFSLHVLWFLVLVFEPTVPTAQAAGRKQEDRVNRIKTGAAGRGG